MAFLGGIRLFLPPLLTKSLKIQAIHPSAKANRVLAYKRSKNDVVKLGFCLSDQALHYQLNNEIDPDDYPGPEDEIEYENAVVVVQGGR